MLLVPAHPVVRVSFTAEQLDDLSPSSRFTMHPVRFDPITDMSAACCLGYRHRVHLYVHLTLRGAGPHPGRALNLLAGMY